MKIGMNKVENVSHAVNLIRRTASKDRPQIVALPECFNSPYGTNYFNDYAETIPDGSTCQQLSEIARETKVYLVGGTIPERDASDNKLYNTCTIWSPTGELIGKYRKVISYYSQVWLFLNGSYQFHSPPKQMHLFDIDVEGGIRFKESDVLSAGNKLTILDVDGFKIGIGICYDIRFEELARIYRNKGTKFYCNWTSWGKH